MKIKNIIQVIRPSISLRFWESAGELSKIAAIHEKWWNKVQSWIDWLPKQIDVESAPLQIVNLIAYQRDIERFSNEPEELYRKRVKYAFLNAKDAGSVVGFYNIWKRLELGVLEQNERLEGQDWDIIELVVNEKILSQYQYLLGMIIEKYGRTCRRYVLATNLTQPAGVRSFAFSYVTDNTLATEKIRLRWGARSFNFAFSTNNSLASAKEI